MLERYCQPEAVGCGLHNAHALGHDLFADAVACDYSDPVSICFTAHALILLTQ